MAGLRIDPGGIREALQIMVEEYESLGFDAPGDDLKGVGDDERSSFLVGCARNCNSAEALNEISAYMNRLRSSIATESGIKGEDRQRALKIHGNAVENIKRCVKRKA